MPHLPLFVTSVIGAGFLATIATLLLGPAPTGHDVVQATGLVLLGSIGIVGFLVTHGLWARRTLLATLVASLLIIAMAPTSVWWWVAVTAIAAGIFVTAGPPLDRWVRQLPPPEPLPYQTIALPLVLMGTVLVTGVAQVDVWPGAAWALTAVFAGWAFGRAIPAGLWVARVAVPLLGLWAAFTAPSWWMAIVVVVTTGVAAWLAWSKQAMLAVSPLQPQRVQPRPVFAEIAPDEVRRAAGIDRSGLPLIEPDGDAP